MLHKIANTIRSLTVDSVERAGSGHPGLPMGCAELGAYLFAEFLRYDPKEPKWVERDRLILSAGHGSLWLYSCLHLAGFAISIEDLKRFRQIDSNTPSHPDLTKTVGVEATTGVDGQGIGYGVGQALALKTGHLRANLHGAKVVVLAGDGCLMEGICYEVCSFAGHLCLDNLIVIYDSNKTTLDGYVEESFSEEVSLRFQAQGWDVVHIDGHDFTQIQSALKPLRTAQKKPVLVIANTVIGRGSPNKSGTPAAHGRPFGYKEIELTKEALGVSKEPFYVDPTIYDFFKERQYEGKAHESIETPNYLKDILKDLKINGPIATRWASHAVLQELAKYFPYLISGSADLSSSDGTYLEKYNVIKKGDFTGRNIKYGVREFGMGCIAAGMAQTGLILPIVGTFLAFADYMRSAIRMTALMNLKVIYQLTHDSVFVGHDGPTHQPIEQIASLRAIPGLLVLRPADSWEVKMAWIAALQHDGPTALILSRQTLEEVISEGGVIYSFEESFGRGAYSVKKEETQEVEYLLIATGSELQLALEVASELGSGTRVVSMPSWELFEKQPLSYKQELLQGKIKVSIEAGVDQGWHKYIGSEGIAISITAFGESGSPSDIASRFGYTKEKILDRVFKKTRAFHEN